jgi:predicted metal-dependent enzyme (double-stranded beta helix superfamily)
MMINKSSVATIMYVKVLNPFMSCPHDHQTWAVIGQLQARLTRV